MNKIQAAKKILSPRPIKNASVGCTAWHYVERNCISIYINVPATGILVTASLTKRQLKEALRLMNTY